MSATSGSLSTHSRRVWARSSVGLTILTAINLLNYLDRYVLSAVLPEIKLDFSLSDGQSGLLGSMFMVVYMLASPFCGRLGDRVTRKYLVAAGVILWSFATIGTGAVAGYRTMLFARALIGIGEAGYATVAPSIIADLYRESSRGRVLAYFYAAIPVGSAFGYLLGGIVGEHLGWRAAFYVAGAPGLLMGALSLLMVEPRRGASDEDGDAGPALSTLAAGRWILSTPAWVVTTVGMTLVTFSIGGLAFWMPTFLIRVHGMSLSRAGLEFGLVLAVAGLAGTLAGGALGDRMERRRAGGRLLVSGRAMLAAALPVAAVALAPSARGVLGLSFVSLLLLALTVGPMNAVLVSSVPPTLRASSVALNILIVHLLGDALSPYLLGWVSDQTTLGTALVVTALPVAVGGVALMRGASRAGREDETGTA